MNNLPYWQQGIKGVKKEAVSKADVRNGDGINTGSSNSGSGTDEFAKKLLARNFENNTLVIPDYITELGPGAINISFNLSTVKLNPDNISVVSPMAFDFGMQTLSRIDEFMDDIDEICSYSIGIIYDMSEGTSVEKMDSIFESCVSLGDLLQDQKLEAFPLFITPTSMFAPMISQINPSSFFDINLSKKAIPVTAAPYCTIELDRDELPANILFINYNEQTGEIQNNLFTPDLNYIKGESFVAPWSLEEFPFGYVRYLDLENLPDTYAHYDCVPINSEEMLSETIKQIFSGTERLIYKTDIVKDGENLFFMTPVLLVNRKIETDQSLNVSLPLLTVKYQENRWYALKQKEEPAP